MTTSPIDDVLLRSEATKDLLSSDKLLLQTSNYVHVLQRGGAATKTFTTEDTEITEKKNCEKQDEQKSSVVSVISVVKIFAPHEENGF